jgi:polar amino acid transport system substrate-binding protein
MDVYGSMLLVLLALFIAQPAQVEADEVKDPAIHFCYEAADQLPYVGPIGPQGRPGILIELIQQAAKDAGLRPSFTRRPWKRCMFNLKAGQSDGIFAVVWQAERDGWGHFPKTESGTLEREWRLWTARYYVYAHKESTLSWDGEKFEGLSFGVSSPLGYVINKRLVDMKVASTESHSVEEGFSLLKLNRLDAYVIDELAGDKQVARLDAKDVLIKHPIPFYKSDWYLPLSHSFVARYPRQAEMFWQSLQKLRLERSDSLIEKYREK